MKTPPQVDVAKFKSWAEAAINTQQEDIGRLSRSVDRIERDMRLFKDFMEEVRTELASNRQLQEQESGEGLASVSAELDALRQQVNSNPRPVSRGSFEISNRSLDIIAKDVQLVGRKVDEIDELKRELGQLKARLSNFENPATSLLEEAAIPSLEGPASTAEASLAHHLNEAQTSVRETRSRRKGDHDQIEISGTSSVDYQRELPAKRRRTRIKPVNGTSTAAAENTSTRPEQQFNARSRLVIEIPSSKGATHSVIPSQDEELHFNSVEDEVNDDYQPLGPATPVSGEDARMDVTPPVDETSLPLSERILHQNKIIEPDYRMREKDFQRGRKRALNELLLTNDSKVNRRSRRFLGDQESQTPSRWSLAPETPRTGTQDIASQQLADPFELPVLPSIEHFESVLHPRFTPQPQPGSLSSSITPRALKPLKCGSCKKQYTSRTGLKYHQEHAKSAECRQGEGNVSHGEFTCDMCGSKFVDLQRLDKHRCRGELGIKITLEDRERSLAHGKAAVAAYEATLAERERLVRQTLDREMSAVL